MLLTKEHATELVEIISSFVKRALSPRDARLAALEKRIADLEARPTTEFRGVWRAETPYRPGDLATRSGSLWACLERTGPEDVPGRSARWQLCVKRGDARE